MIEKGIRRRYKYVTQYQGMSKLTIRTGKIITKTKLRHI